MNDKMSYSKRWQWIDWLHLIRRHLPKNISKWCELVKIEKNKMLFIELVFTKNGSEVVCVVYVCVEFCFLISAKWHDRLVRLKDFFYRQHNLWIYIGIKNVNTQTEDVHMNMSGGQWCKTVETGAYKYHLLEHFRVIDWSVTVPSGGVMRLFCFSFDSIVQCIQWPDKYNGLQCDCGLAMSGVRVANMFDVCKCLWLWLCVQMFECWLSGFAQKCSIILKINKETRETGILYWDR